MWICCFTGKQVYYFQRTKSPVLRKSDTTADGRVISLRICRTGIKHNECYPWMVCRPSTPESVAIGVCYVKYGTAIESVLRFHHGIRIEQLNVQALRRLAPILQ